MPRALVALTLALAVLAGGCAAQTNSKHKFNGEERKVAERVDKLQSAGEAHDAKSICDDVLAKGLREQVSSGGSSCESELDKAIKDADDFKLDVQDVTINGNQATAKVEGRDRGAKRVHTFTFVREGKEWRATDLGS